MRSNRLCALAAVCVFPLSITACSSDDDDDDTEFVVPVGDHHTYVVQKTTLPRSQATATELGIDVGGPKSKKPDGIVENKLGNTLGSLSSSVDIQGSVDRAVDRGEIILLADLQTTAFDSADAAGLTLKLGATASPAPCTDANDLACRHHLDGTATITVAADQPASEPAGGKITNGTLVGANGTFPLQIAFSAAPPVTFTLHNARTKATSLSETGLTAVVAGAITVSDVNDHLVPAVATQINALITTTCPNPDATKRACGCTDGTLALILPSLDGADGSAPNCEVSNEEIIKSSIFGTAIAPDVCLGDSCSSPDGLSLGLKIEAVKATF